MSRKTAMNQKTFDEVYAIWKNAKPNQKIWSDALAKGYGYSSGEALRSAFRRMRKRKMLEEKESGFSNKPKEIFSSISSAGKSVYQAMTQIHKDGSITSEKIIAIENQDLKSPIIMMELHGFDADLWELTYCKNNYWEMGNRHTEDGKAVHYQSKITCRPRKIPLLSERSVKTIFDSVVREYKFPSALKFDRKKDDKDGDLLIIGLADLHYALKAEMPTSNNEYNPQIAKKIFNHIIKDVLEKVSHRNISEIILWNGGDFFNCDNLNGTTTRGTPQDNAMNYYDMLKTGAQILMEGIDMLSSFAPVRYLYSVSNHDQHSIYSLALILDAWYKDNPRVNVVTSTLERQYIEFGNSVLGFAHDMSPKKAHMVMSEEAKDIWYLPFKYFFLGHTHHENVFSDGSVEVRRVSTPSGNSAWSYSHGYVGTIKKSQSFILSKRYGLTDIINTVIEE